MYALNIILAYVSGLWLLITHVISSAVTMAEPSVSRAAKSDLSWFWNSTVSTTASGLTRVTGPVATITSLSSDEVFWSVSTGGLIIKFLH